MWISYWGSTESQWAPHIFGTFKKNWKFTYKPHTDPQGKSLILVKSVVTSSLQTFPLIGTWSRFHQQFKRGFMSYWSYIFLSSFKIKPTFWNSELSYRCTFPMSICMGQAPEPTCFCTDSKWFPSLLAAPHKSYQLINGWQKESCSWTVPDFWQQGLTTHLKKSLYGDLVTLRVNEPSHPYYLQDH